MEGTTVRDHTRLKVFNLADQLAISIYRESTGFPRSEHYGLRAQIRRAAVSIAANIVEGSARTSQAEYLRFLDIAYASAKELQYEISLCERLGLLNHESARKVETECLATVRALGGLLKSIQKA